MALEKITSVEATPLSNRQMQDFKGGAGLCGNAEIFFPNNPLLNDVANHVVHAWREYKASSTN